LLAAIFVNYPYDLVVSTLFGRCIIIFTCPYQKWKENVQGFLRDFMAKTMGKRWVALWIFSSSESSFWLGLNPQIYPFWPEKSSISRSRSITVDFLGSRNTFRFSMLERGHVTGWCEVPVKSQDTLWLCQKSY